MKKLILFFSAVLISMMGFAQLTGNKYIPGAGGPNDYATIALAIADLNTQGVGTGGVTFNIAAGYSENITAPLIITATGTSGNEILFIKSGDGANPIVTRTDAGTVTTPTTLGNPGDAVIIIEGSDYVTFDAIDIATLDQGIEYGFLLRKASATDGCKYVDIKNAGITMTKGTSAHVAGIYVSNLDATSTGVAGVTVTSTGGRHENIGIYGNTISNVHNGILLRGYAHTSSPYDFLDQNITIGGPGGLGNVFQNFAGGATGTSYAVYMIYQTNPTIEYNVINNTAGGGSNATGLLYGVFNTTSGLLGALNVNYNDITLTNQSTSATYAIYSGIAGTEYNMNYNTITGVGTSTGTHYAIYASSSTPNVNVIGNEITSTQGGGAFYGYYNLGSPASGTEVVANNTVTNVTVAAGTSGLYGLYSNTATGQNRTWYGNNVTNLTHSGTGLVYPLYALSTTTNQIYNNTVHSITAGGTVYGLYFTGTNPEVYNNNVYNMTTSGTTMAAVYNAGTGTTNMYKNKIYNIQSTATSPTVSGILLTAGTANYVYNNFISDIKAPASGTDNSVRGINITSTTTNSTVGLYYNTIFLKGTSTGTNFGSSGVFHTYNLTATTASLDMRNNIIVNTSTPNGTGRTVAFRRSASTNLNNYGEISNNNAFYAGTPGANNLLFFDGTNGDQTIADFRTRVSPRESVSITEVVPFVNTTTAPFDLTLLLNVPTQIESGAQVISTPLAIADDYFGTSRNATTPDIGAFEGNMTGQDLTPPLIQFTPVANSPFTTPVTLTAQISDPSGVPQAGIGLPVLYWKLNLAGTYTPVQGTYVLNDDYSFTFGSGVALGDTVFYYIVAQDNPGNVGATSSAGVTGYSTNPPSVTPDPTNPNFYSIVSSMSGAYTVGTGGDYETLTGTGGLFESINGKVIIGNITATIISNLSETGAVALNEWTEAGGSGYTLTIQPDAATMRTIDGTYAGGLIRLNGADRVTIDGSFSGSGKYLTFENKSTGTSAVIQISSLGVNAGATNNTIQNCIIIGGSSTATTTFGIYAGSTSVSTSGTGAHNNDLMIQNNEIKKAYRAVYVSGVASTGLVTGLNIKDNIIGSDVVTDYVLFRGVELANATGAVIDGNKIFNLKLATSVNNAGIDLGANVADAIVSGNEIYGIYSTSTSGYGAYGINISATTTSNITIVNNVIYDIITRNYSLTSTIYNAFGIRITGGTNHKVYFNNVHLFGNVTEGTSNAMSAAFIVTSSSATGLDVRNNIFSNTTQFLNAASRSYAAYVVSGTAFGTINYNNYFSGGSNAMLGFYGADKADLATWQASSGQDANSENRNPQFTSDTDLTPSNPYLNASADATVPYFTDFNGVTRSTPPDFGAIEFTPPLCPDPSVLTAINIQPTQADLGWTPGFSETQWNVQVYLAGGVFGVDVPVASVTGTTNNPWTATGLTQYTDYEFYVQSDCQTNGTSAWVGPLAFTTTVPSLSGTYTIDSTQPTAGTNFNSFTDFATIIGLGGLSGPVTVNVVAGTGPYTEQFMLNELAGSSSLNTLTINGNGETLQFTSTNTNERATMKLNGTDFVTVNNLIVKALGTTGPSPTEYGWAVWLTNNADNNAFVDCEFHATTASTSTNFAAFVTSSSATGATTAGPAASYLTVTGCTSIGGYYGMIINGNTSTAPFSDGNMIIGNEIRDFYLYGLYLRGQTNSMFNENEIHRTNRTDAGTTYMIYLSGNMGMVDVSKNQIYNLAGSGTTTSTAYGVYGTGVTAPSGEGIMFSNNAIWGYKGMNGTQYGFYFTTHTAATLVYHNTVSLDNLTHPGSSLIYCFYHSGANAILDIQNNIFSYTTNSTGAKYNLYFATNTAVVNSNYNVLHRGATAGTTNRTGYWSATPYETLADWQTANGGIYDQNSVDFDPIFGSPIPLSANVDNIGTNLLSMVPEDINGVARTATPDPGAYEFDPVNNDIAVMSGLLVRTTDCLNANDSIYVTIKNNIGGLIDFSVTPLAIGWEVTGPVASSGTFNVNTGTLASGASLTVGSNGVDMSEGGTFVLSKAYISPNAVNQYTPNDTIYDAHSIITIPYTFNALPALTNIVSSADTVNLTVQSNVLAGTGSFFMTEICHYKTTTGAPVGGWPSYLIADDYVEITGVPNSDLSGYTLEIWTSSALESASVLGTGTLIGPNGTCIIATGQLGSSVPSPANYYYHSGATATQSSTTAKGYILRAPGGAIVDAVVYGTLTFPAASGVTANDWTGNTPAVSSSGNRLEGPYTKNSVNWVNSGTSPQNPNVVNQNVSVPSPTGLTDFLWTLNGTTVAQNQVDITVGPWTTNGTYNYIASYTNQCGTFVSTAVVEVNIPPYDLVLLSIDAPDAELCYTGDEDVTITFKNIGSSTVNFPFTASYQVDSNTPVTETLTMTVAPAEIITYTFTTPLSYNLTANFPFHLTTWVSLTGDNDLSNDTLDMDVLFKFSPDLPVGQPDTVSYNQPATLVATSNGLIYWYADATSPAFIGTGDTLITPPLFATTNYYAAAASVAGGELQLGTGTVSQSTTGVTPYSSNYEGVRIQYLLRASELAALGIFPGDISSIAFDVTTAGAGTQPQIGYTVKIAHTNDAAFAGAYGTPSGAWTQVYYNAALPAPTVGWNTLAFSTPFNWDGASNILIDICHDNDIDGSCGTCYSGNSTVRATTTSFNSVYGRYNDNLPACGVEPTLVISTFTSRPNMKLNAQVLSCYTDRVPVEAVVNLPAIEPAVVSIESPLDEECYEGTNVVSIKITNFGTSTILTGLTASYQIDAGIPVTENVTDPIANGDTIVFTFATPVNLTLTGDSTVNLTVWVDHASDPYHLNDTASKSVNFGYIPPAPVAVDALNVPFATAATLGATSAYTVTWYDSPVSTTPVGTGSTFVTPVLYNNATYYASASAGSGSAFVGAYDNTIGTTSSYANTTYYMIFNVLDANGLKIKNIDVFPSTAAGEQYSIQLLDNNGNLLDEYSSVTTVASGQRETVPVDFDVPYGNNFRIKFGVSNGFWRNTTGASYPYTIPDLITITGNSFNNNAYYYWFYNWEVGSGVGCESDRTPVTAYVDMPSCIPIVAVNINNITASTADLSWAQAGSETAWQIELGVAGFTPLGVPTHFVSGTPATTLMNLGNMTDYEFYIRSDCGTETSAWWGPYSFSTLLCNPVDQCNYTFNLIDEYGDGWNGAQMQVLQNGVVVGTLGTTFTTGYSFTETVALCHGLDFQVNWNIGGSWPEEVGLEVLDAFGNQIYYQLLVGSANVGTILFTSNANCIPPVKEFNLNAYLEGLYLGSGMMREAQGLSGPQFGAGIADEIIVELYDAVNTGLMHYQNTNVTLNTSGSAVIDDIPYSLNGSYYVVIKHRNSIETWSAAPVSFDGAGPISYNFTIAASQAYNNNQRAVPGGFYAIYSGDANQDDIVDGSDMLEVENASNVFLLGYNPQDLNGDGLVDGSDMLLIENNANNFVQVFRP